MSTITWQDAFQEFLLCKQAEGRSPLTLRDYHNHVPAFFQEHPDTWPDVHALKRAVVAHFAGLRERSATHYNLRREYLKAFFSWCVREEYLPKNPVDGIPKRKNDGTPRNLDDQTLKRLLELPDKSTYAGVRDHALVLLQLDTGIRPGEALQLLPAHFNLGALEVTVPSATAKTRTARTVVMSPQTAKAIRRLLSVRPADWTDDVPVFATYSGRPMDRNMWGKRLAQYGRTLGVRITPYMLRHSSALMFLRGGGHVFALQRQLGHTSLVMTKRYVHLADSDLHQQHAVASPVANLLPQRTRARKVK
ncbi:site-specific integrase [Kyrpidia tusciae]|uniref:Integrase family protein n=1 Tax=Kyrpidia tusciae (strain DSM 2912 / NBRC 15312 / T2) TaxID=562970 RepID=D5WQN8_KYRT2|nr:tyrosine-type recombinase/integrase [Kyrpidia tusciae]ADG06647.1 integrase family protein [Kyrpidia tusciae DSM 2912]